MLNIFARFWIIGLLSILDDGIIEKPILFTSGRMTGDVLVLEVTFGNKLNSTLKQHLSTLIKNWFEYHLKKSNIF